MEKGKSHALIEATFFKAKQHNCRRSGCFVDYYLRIFIAYSKGNGKNPIALIKHTHTQFIAQTIHYFCLATPYFIGVLCHDSIQDSSIG